MAYGSGKKPHLAYKRKIEKFKKSGKGTRTDWAAYKKKTGLPKYSPIA